MKPASPAPRSRLLILLGATAVLSSPVRSAEKPKPAIVKSLPATAAVSSTVSMVPFAPRKGGAGKRFTRLADPKTTGIAFINRVNNTHPYSYLYHSGMVCGGLAIGDVDADGKPDIYLSNGPGKNKLYRQTTPLKFEDITATSGNPDGGDAWTAGVSMADIDGDGDLDIYVSNYMAPNQLYINQGPGKNGQPVTFQEMAKDYGLDTIDCSHSSYWADYDRDGDLDLYLLTNRIEDPAGMSSELPTEVVNGTLRVKPSAAPYYSLWRWDADNWGTEPSGTEDILYRNDGKTPDGKIKFTNVTKQAGIEGRGDGLSATWWDYDLDGDLDLFVANDFISTDRLYRNNSDGTFTNVLPQAAPHTSWFSMGADFGDINNDLWPDYVMGDMSATTHYKSKTTMGVMGGTTLKRANASEPPQYMRNVAYLNTGTGHFQEIAYQLGLASTDWTWSIKFADLDQDGWQDLFFTNGVVRKMNDSDHKITQDMLLGKHTWDFFKDGETRPEQHRAYRNTQHLHFDDVSADWGLDHTAVSYGCAYSDLDRDGDLDFVMVTLEENVSILRNDGTDGNSIQFKLNGTHSNTHGIGARIIIKTAAGSQMRQLSPQTGYHSGNEPILHFGLGAETNIPQATIQWPNGIEQTLTNLTAGNLYTITEPATGPAHTPPPKPQPIFKPTDTLAQSKHIETPFDDYTKQLLLPSALSTTGPGIAWADVDGDGDQDYYLAKGAGQIGEIRFNNNGKFTPRFNETFRADKDTEDQAPIFLDADGDGDQDLFIAGGSYQFDTAAKEQRDRLYLNDGKGNYTPAPEGALPIDTMPAGAAAAADYDRDGDLDIFVGDRCQPGEWPLAVNGRILTNDGKAKFTDTTNLTAPDLIKTGLVTGAVWTDANNDGWLDLAVSHEWGPVRLLLNKNGKLAKVDGGVLEKTLGWWNSVTAADVDHDGDLDLIAGNQGWNSKYKLATPDKPRLLHYGDFENTGKRKIVEVKREGDKLFPERGRSCSSTEMPFLKTKFPTYHLFASSTLEEVYTPEKLAQALRYEANEFASGIFINDGKANYTFRPFPDIAQISPTYGIATTDFDADGHPDIYLSQNSHAPQAETGNYDGGLGQLLLGDGKGNFTPITPLQSGITEPGDTKATTIADLDGDQRPDLVIAKNNAPLRAWLNQSQGQTLRVELPPARAPGARVTITRPGQPTQTAEYAAGSGCLSQNAPILYFGLGTAAPKGTIKIRWADGKITEQKFDQREVKITTR